MKENKPKVLFWDVETTYVRARIWNMGKQYVGHEKIVDGDRTKIICIGYKWLGEKKTHILKWNNKTQDCSKIIRDFSKVVEEADVAIAHNGDRFDVKHFNTQCLLYGLPPVNWPTTEDTLKQLRQKFYLPSYKLDYVAKMLFGEGKNPMNFQDWIDIIEGKNQKTKDAALEKMIKYCKKDVQLLEDAWKVVAPYLEPKVNRSLIKNNHRLGCPSCGNDKVHKDGRKVTKSGIYQRYQCQTCGHKFRGSKKLPEGI